MIKFAFEDVSSSRCVIFDLFKRFKVGRISIEDDHGFGRLLISKTNK